MINNFFYKLNELREHPNKNIGRITNIIIDTMKQNKIIDSTKKLAQLCSVSPSMITKYTKISGYNNTNEILFLMQEIVNQEKNQKHTSKNNIYKEIATYIWSCRKIQLVGRGNAYITNQDFKSKLERLDLWAIQANSKYEEIGYANLLTYKDLMIINSTTLQHDYINQLITNSNCKILLITNNQKIKETPNMWVINYQIDNIEQRFDRYYTMQARNLTLTIFDNIFKEIMNIDGAIELLKLTRYK